MKDPSAFDFDGEYGEGYDDLVRLVIPGYDHLFEATLALFRTRLAGDARVLIVGCGTGKEIATLAPAEPQWRFTAVDPSEKMVQGTTNLAKRLGVTRRVVTHHGYVSDLPPEAVFDAATVINVMHFLADDGAKDQLMESVSTRTRPGGLVALFDLHGTPGSPTCTQLFDGWSQFMDIQGLTGGAKQQFLARLEQGMVYVPEERVLAICSNAGLSLCGRYFGGFLYGGWLFSRDETAPG